MKLLRNIINYTINRLQISVSLRTKNHLILDFIAKLHPINTQFQLIRFGPESDGGYLIPDDLDGIEACFSPGVELKSGFELDCAERGMKVFMADLSVYKPKLEHPLFSFTKKFIGSINSNEFITMDNWVNESLVDKNSDLLLQMDIEGAEYEVILNISEELLKRFRIIVIEFHYLFNMYNQPVFDLLITKSFEKILRTHSCIHIHPNNCDNQNKYGDIKVPNVMEFTFLRNDRINSKSFANQFPHKLDNLNCPERPPIDLPTCWYKSNL